MKEKIAWNQFLKTGKIEDYLKYRQIHNDVEIARENSNEKRNNENTRNSVKEK